MPGIPYSQAIIEQTLSGARHQLRDPGDFNHDMYRWEFSALASLYGRMRTQLRACSALGVEYSTGDTSWVLYKAGLDVIPGRPKHGERRNGRPSSSTGRLRSWLTARPAPRRPTDAPCLFLLLLLLLLVHLLPPSAGEAGDGYCGGTEYRWGDSADRAERDRVAMCSRTPLASPASSGPWPTSWARRPSRCRATSSPTALDDRDRVVALWRSLGIVCMQVDEGNF